MISEVVDLTIQMLKCGDNDDSHLALFKLVKDSLSSLSFSSVVIDASGKPNLFLEIGKTGPLLVFLGHSDVVSPGDITKWKYSPFSGVIENEVIYGRGSVDMRSAIAAFCIAVKNTPKDILENYRIGIVLTSDEETSCNGAPAVLKYLEQNNKSINLCVVGEPTAKSQTGDKIKIGRRGGLSGHFKFYGDQGHTAYLSGEVNVLNRSVKVANGLLDIEWPSDLPPWPNINFHITNFCSGIGENNTVPSSAEFKINVRFGPSLSREMVINKCEEIIKKLDNLEISWSKGAQPYLTKDEKVLKIVSDSIQDVTGVTPEFAVDGGTSDGRFFANSGVSTVEIGVPGIGLHEINESVKTSDLELLVKIYKQLLMNFKINK